VAFDSNGISLLLEMQMVIYQLTPTNNKISSKKKLETLVAAIKKSSVQMWRKCASKWYEESANRVME
jgi:hypothetical protein